MPRKRPWFSNYGAPSGRAFGKPTQGYFKRTWRKGSCAGSAGFLVGYAGSRRRSFGDEQPPTAGTDISYAEASSVGKLSEEEKAAMAKAKEIYDSKALVPCTRCAYCMPCPAGLNIPSLINKYNNTALYDFEEVKKDYMSSEVKGRCLHRVSCLRGRVPAAFEAERAHAQDSCIIHKVRGANKNAASISYACGIFIDGSQLYGALD